MHPTLFTIPSTLAGIPVFGFGWLLGLWAVASTLLVIAMLRKPGGRSELLATLPALALSGAAIAFILPRVIEADGLAIRGYGVLLLVAVASGVGLSLVRARQRGIDPELILSLATWLFVAGLIGARVFFVIEYWQDFLRPSSQNPQLIPSLLSMLNVTRGGLVVYGAMLAGAAALLVFVRKHRLTVLAMTDLVAPGVVLGMGIGRLGCFMTGCCFGGVCSLPWAVEFPYKSPPYIQQVERGQLPVHGLTFEGPGIASPVVRRVERESPAALAGLKSGDRITHVGGKEVRRVDEAVALLLEPRPVPGTVLVLRTSTAAAPVRLTLTEDPRVREHSLAVHPAQLYSAFDAILLCLFLLAYEPFQRRTGELTALVLTLHPISRFLLEIVRVDEGAVFGTSLSISQNISIAIFAGGLVLWAYLLTRPAAAAPQPQPAV